jgi:uncharacterized protein (DUF1330 family)
MSAYLLAQLRFRDIAAYRRYEANFPAVFRKFGGRVLVADESPTILEGTWTRHKVVLLQFPDRAAALRFSEAPEYREIARDRIAGADTVVLLLSGYPGSPLPGRHDADR